MKQLESLEAFEKLKDEFMVIDFGAKWCGPCRMISPVFEQMSKENEKIAFYKVDIEEAQDLSKKFEIKGLPTFLFFKNQKVVKELTLVGANKTTLKENLANLVKVN